MLTQYRAELLASKMARVDNCFINETLNSISTEPQQNNEQLLNNFYLPLYCCSQYNHDTTKNLQISQQQKSQKLLDLCGCKQQAFQHENSRKKICLESIKHQRSMQELKYENLIKTEELKNKILILNQQLQHFNKEKLRKEKCDKEQKHKKMKEEIVNKPFAFKNQFSNNANDSQESETVSFVPMQYRLFLLINQFIFIYMPY